MPIKSIKDANIKEKRVLVRVDFNVPLEDGKITDDTRITKTLPTIEYLLEQGAKIILVTHIGRPGGEVVEDLRTNPVAERLSELLKKDIKKLDDSIGEEVEKEISSM
ncbi:phosphoglycerate kinase, partial [Pseudomonadota bacterium]